jgi:hypothetical protein
MRRDKDCPHFGSMAVIGELVLAQEAADRAADAAGLPRPPRPPQRPPRTRQEAEHRAESEFYAASYEYEQQAREAAEKECRRIWFEGGLDSDDWREVKPEIKAPHLCKPGAVPHVDGYDAGYNSALIVIAQMAVMARQAGPETWNALMAAWWPHGNPMGNQCRYYNRDPVPQS